MSNSDLPIVISMNSDTISGYRIYSGGCRDGVCESYNKNSRDICIPIKY